MINLSYVALVPIRSSEPARFSSVSTSPVDLRSASAAEVFDILYPPLSSNGATGEMQRQQFRAEFTRRTTELIDNDGTRIGLATLGYDLYWPGPRRIEGAVLVNGFRSDELDFFVGYMEGKPSRASRDNVEISADQITLRQWINSQATRLKELNLFTHTNQMELAHLLYLANHTLGPEHNIAMTAEG